MSKHTSIYQQLGYTPDTLPNDRCSTREFQVGVFEQPSGDPIIGLHYMCDFRAEEEWGVSDLRKAITTDNPRQFKQSRKATKHIATFSDVNGLVLSVRDLDFTSLTWDEQIDPYMRRQYPDKSSDYAEFMDRERFDYRLLWKYEDKKLPELRQDAKGLGISPLPRKKADLVNAILNKVDTLETRTSWPGWFHFGKDLVLRADAGPVADVLTKIIEATRKGTLGIGNGSGPFSSGLFLYDTRDESKELQKKREADFDWYDARMAELEPVAKDLEENFLKFYFLGNPSTLDTGDGRQVVRYWLNSHGTKHAYDGRQIFGWFTLEELQDRSFVGKYNERRQEAS